MRARWGLGLFAAGLAAAYAVFLVVTELDKPLVSSRSNERFYVQEGDGLIRVLASLERRGLIRSALLARASARLRRDTVIVKPGEYQLLEGETIQELLLRLDTNDSVVYPVTIPEGVTFQWMLETLWAHPKVTRSLRGASDARVMELIEPYASPEGLFLPETYLIESGTTDLSILRQARDAMTQTLERLWQGHEPSLPYASAYEALIMASIIEKETGVAHERAQIAGVFVRRLQRGMRLQTDPTIIYGLGDAFDGNLTRRHLRDRRNPYNTYEIAGLPPTPIALPGVDAILAAVNPQSGESLYFVATGEGGHAFSETLAEHRDNVRRYQLNRAEDYRSSPR